MTIDLPTLIGLYSFGLLYIGLPAARLSLKLYSLGADMERHRQRKLLIILRYMLHPGSFIFGYTHPERSNNQLNYKGPIAEIVKKDDIWNLASRDRYLFWSSFAWPLRLLFCVTVLSVITMFHIANLPWKWLDVAEIQKS